MKYIPRAALLTLAILGLQGCCFPTSGQGAAKARSLSQEQLETLYTQMEKYQAEAERDDGDGSIRWGEFNQPMPEEFARAGAIWGEVRRDGRLMFGGCWDDKAVLIFDGLGSAGPKEIWLVPGELLEPEVLWRAPEEPSATP